MVTAHTNITLKKRFASIEVPIINYIAMFTIPTGSSSYFKTL